MGEKGGWAHFLLEGVSEGGEGMLGGVHCYVQGQEQDGPRKGLI